MEVDRTCIDAYEDRDHRLDHRRIRYMRGTHAVYEKYTCDTCAVHIHTHLIEHEDRHPSAQLPYLQHREEVVVHPLVGVADVRGGQPGHICLMTGGMDGGAERGCRS